jgi:hypothetical protein
MRTSLAEAERLRQSLLADPGRGDSLKTIIYRIELRPERSAEKIGCPPIRAKKARY